MAHVVEFVIPSSKWCSVAEAVDEFSRTIDKQMDMRREANHLLRFSENFKHTKDVFFPRPRSPLCSDDVLVEDFVHGESMKDFVKRCQLTNAPSLRTRTKLAKIGVDAVCKMIFHDNLLHGDLHPGNILVTNDGQDGTAPTVCFLDAGIVVELKKHQHRHFVQVLSAFMRHDGQKAGELMLSQQQSKNNEADIDKARDDFCKTLKSITDNVADEPFFENVSSYTTRIFDSAARSKVRLEGYFVSTAIAIRVMEGVANALDKDVKIGDLALPWIVSSS